MISSDRPDHLVLTETVERHRRLYPEVMAMAVMTLNKQGKTLVNCTYAKCQTSFSSSRLRSEEFSLPVVGKLAINPTKPNCERLSFYERVKDL